MTDRVNAPPFFGAQAAGEFENPQGTRFLLRRGGAGLIGGPEWREKQDAFIKWTRDPAMFNEADVAQNTALYRKFFEETRGLLAGRVLDVGGGWGLFRKWWKGDAAACYTVHDPGVERFTVSPPAALQRHFGEGLARPAWFVEGFGEQLPYQDGSYDVVMIASALDHCADPARVLAEAHRVLRPGGTLLVIQGFEHEHGGPVPEGRRFHERLLRLLADPRRLYRAIRMRVFHRGEPHMHHFSREELRTMVSAAGYGAQSETVISERFGVMALEAAKPA